MAMARIRTFDGSVANAAFAHIPDRDHLVPLLTFVALVVDGT